MTADRSTPPCAWPEVRERLAALAAADPLLRRFGAGSHRYVLRPTLSEAAVTSFETQHRITLPRSYRSFLLEVADGGTGPAHGLLGLTELPPDDDALFDLKSESLTPGFLASPFPHLTAQPGPSAGTNYDLAGSLAIGESGCGTFSRLVVTGPCAGQVWTDDQVWTALAPGPDFRDWYTAWLDLRQQSGP
ncbi:SMI1/KNR4 family protein [Kitasatospora sp. NPDC059646]|uniref:SMI1/KNR4 family protein n=1 Tax=Kitasatospora sp. NPDC059646 TaxID=3346893 RepID=UPI0036A3A47B